MFPYPNHSGNVPNPKSHTLPTLSQMLAFFTPFMGLYRLQMASHMLLDTFWKKPFKSDT